MSRKINLIPTRFYPFIVSAHTKEATEELAVKLRVYLEQNDIDNQKLKEIAYTLCCRRNQYPFSYSIVSDSKEGIT